MCASDGVLAIPAAAAGIVLPVADTMRSPHLPLAQAADAGGGRDGGSIATVAGTCGCRAEAQRRLPLAGRRQHVRGEGWILAIAGRLSIPMLRCGKVSGPGVQSAFVGKQPATDMQEQTLYVLLGGETTIARLCDRFYELMAQVPQFATIRALHPADLRSSRDKLFMFLSGWLGGPDLYVQHIGHPMLRRRHMPFAIGEDERDQWVACMLLAMESIGIEQPLREKLLTAFFSTADFMRNQPGTTQS